MSTERPRLDAAAGKGRSTLVGDFLAFLMENKKWWLLPIFVVFLLMTLIIVLGSSAAAPFIYTLF